MRVLSDGVSHGDNRAAHAFQGETCGGGPEAMVVMSWNPKRAKMTRTRRRVAKEMRDLHRAGFLGQAEPGGTIVEICIKRLCDWLENQWGNKRRDRQ